MPFWPPLNLCPIRRPSSWGLAPLTCAAGSTWKLREWGGTPVKDDASSDDLGSHKWKPWVSLKSSPIKQEGFFVIAPMPSLSLACPGLVILPATPASQGHCANIITSKCIIFRIYTKINQQSTSLFKLLPVKSETIFQHGFTSYASNKTSFSFREWMGKHIIVICKDKCQDSSSTAHNRDKWWSA